MHSQKSLQSILLDIKYFVEPNIERFHTRGRQPYVIGKTIEQFLKNKKS